MARAKVPGNLLMRILRAGWMLPFYIPCVGAADELAANPYRPSVGSPASLSAPGYFEGEAGFANETAGNIRTRSMPMLLKYAFTDRIGVTFGISPWTKVTDPVGTHSGNSDGAITLKLAQPINRVFMMGSELTVSVPVASSGLGSVHSDVTLNLIASTDFAGFHSDLNLNSTRVGDTPALGGTRYITAGSAGLSHALNDHWGATIEVSGSRQGVTSSSTQWLGALSYTVNPRWVLDAYAARERLDIGHSQKFGFGMTYLFAGK